MLHLHSDLMKFNGATDAQLLLLVVQSLDIAGLCQSGNMESSGIVMESAMALHFHQR